MNDMKYPKVYLFILCHNSKIWLKSCLDTLSQTDYKNYKVHVIDNDSVDGSVDYISQLYPNITIIKNKKNLGWCKANNIGIELASKERADYVMFLNSDVKFEQREWLSHLVTFAQSNPEYAIYGCTQYDYDTDGFSQINSWTKYILRNGNRDIFYTWNKNVNHIVKNKPAYLENIFTRRHYIECFFVQGAAMMVKRGLFDEIGMFDDIYFIFQDEVDFSRRARYRGYKTALIFNSKIKHVGSGDNSSSKKRINRRNFYYSRNKYIFLLTDINRNWLDITSILVRFILADIKDACIGKKDISGVWQLLLIFFSIFTNAFSMYMKRKREIQLRIT